LVITNYPIYTKKAELEMPIRWCRWRRERMYAEMASTGAGSGATDGKSEMNILMIEDNPADFRLIKEMLVDVGSGGVMTTAFKLGHADRLSKGLEILSHEDVDLILLDLSLPDSQGIETVVRTHSQSPETPIVVVSGSDDDAIARQVMQVGAKEFLFKGRIDGAVLMQSMRDSLQHKMREREVTSLRQHVLGLESRVADLERSNMALDSYAYTVSHELRAPIRAMEGFAKALIEDFGADIDPTAFDYADRIIDSARKMDDAVQEILQYCRVTTSDIAMEQVDLDAVMTEALASIEDQRKARDAVITLDPVMPIVRGSHETLVMVMSNLLSNAIKFVDPEKTPKVSVRAERIDGHVRIWVEDNGIGISPDHVSKVFEPFERLNGGRAFPGTGIGLAIVSAAASRMDGRAGVESEPGVGSRFWIELPRSW